MSRAAAPTRVRCAIYTRKSSEEGLDQAFNSLQAQREACEAYVLSQAGEGWKASPTLYDDGGYSGGNLDRPGLRRLLTDIEAGRVDTVVVYKIDRLTRSLADFAKIVEIFDARSVSFVSVTQAFNTTTSMGRLTLNVLLSFAQFEREVTGERIRDKIAASKKKGMWMGGTPPLGYDPPTDLTTRALVVKATEAKLVRLIFERYLELGSVDELQRWLSLEGITSKAWITRRGKAMDGSPFGRGALFHLLKSRTYLGEIPHGSETYPGAHPAIVDATLFDRVQAHLATQTRRSRASSGGVASAQLRGLIFDADGEPMSPIHTRGRHGKVHRYYVSASLLRGVRRDPADPAIRRVPGPAVERLVEEVLARLADRTDPVDALVRVNVKSQVLEMELRRAALVRRSASPDRDLATIRARLEPDETLAFAEAEDGALTLTLPCRFKRAGGRVRVTDASGRSAARGAQSDQTLVSALKAAHALLAEGCGAAIGRPEDGRLEVAPDHPYKRSIVRLAFLAPDIQAAILEGRQPAGLNRQRLVAGDIPAAWEDQRRAFGFA
jgi:site-specific DNA recombinase